MQGNTSRNLAGVDLFSWCQLGALHFLSEVTDKFKRFIKETEYKAVLNVYLLIYRSTTTPIVFVNVRKGEWLASVWIDCLVGVTRDLSVVFG